MHNIAFTVRTRSGSELQNVARISADGKTLSGTSTAIGNDEGRQVRLSYGWEMATVVRASNRGASGAGNGDLNP